MEEDSEQNVVNSIQADEETKTTQRDADGSGGNVSDLELLNLCLKGCLLGAAVYAYSLYLNLEQGLSMEIMDDSTGEVRIATPFTPCTNPHKAQPAPAHMFSFLARLHPTPNRPPHATGADDVC